MARKDEPYKSPFENLGAPAINRRFVTADPPKRVVAPKVEKAKAVLAKAERAAKPLATPKPKKPKPPAEPSPELMSALDIIKKRGRPTAPKPWEAEGITRQAWYKRGNRKAAGE